jgi:hypothetical protein
MKKLLLALAACASLAACGEIPGSEGDTPAKAGEVNL